MDLLKLRRADVSYYDPCCVLVIRSTHERPKSTGTNSIYWDRAMVAGFDALFIVTVHACINYQEIAHWARCIVDIRNAMASVQSPGGWL